MLQKSRDSNQKGFTLIELMVVIAIIGILSAIAIPNFLSYRTSSGNAVAQAAAGDWYTCAIAEVTDTGLAFDGDPDTYTSNAKVTVNVGDCAIPANGLGSGSATFVHDNGDETCALNCADGSIICA